MFSFQMFQHIGPELPLALLLMALLGFRARVNCNVSLLVKASPERLWELLNPYDGKVDNWGRTTVVTRLASAETQTYEIVFTTTTANGAMRPFKALFEARGCVPQRKVLLVRAGLEGKSQNNELLEIQHILTPEGQGTRVSTRYLWGSRQLLAQLLARADLWGGAYRLKSLAETGVPDNRPYLWISAGVALITGIASVGAFGLSIGLWPALILVLALLVHEFGHLLAFRLIGQPWGRVVFLPFLGAVAVPRLPLESQGQSVFSALMGPGFSCLVAAACGLPYFLAWPSAPLFALAGLLIAGLNLFNLLPAEPLDGGVALRSVLSRLIGKYAPLGLVVIGLVIVMMGFFLGQLLLVLFGSLAVLVNLKPRKIDQGLVPLTSLQVSISFFGYVMIAVAHYTMLYSFLGQIGL